jgi:hypothetical protein
MGIPFYYINNYIFENLEQILIEDGFNVKHAGAPEVPPGFELDVSKQPIGESYTCTDENLSFHITAYYDGILDSHILIVVSQKGGKKLKAVLGKIDRMLGRYGAVKG